MESITKPKMSQEQLATICQHHLGDALDEAIELKDGWFNAAFLLRTVGGKESVLKAAPPDSVQLMRYERNLMHAEVSAIRMVKAMTDVPVPAVYAYDSSREFAESEFFLTDRLPGRPLDQVRGEMSLDLQEQVDAQVGTILRAIHTITGPRFGTFNQAEHETWADAFKCLMGWLHQDATDLGVHLPKGVFSIVDRHTEALESVQTPTLVHWDLWDGNIFVDPKLGVVTGIIDFERVLWADPLIETNFGHIRSGFIQTYGDEILQGEHAKLRRHLYDLYLFLIMVIECRYRHLPSDHEANIRVKLDETIEAIHTAA